jgi:MFS superfamily sulfate permease-like transporter
VIFLMIVLKTMKIQFTDTKRRTIKLVFCIVCVCIFYNVKVVFQTHAGLAVILSHVSGVNKQAEKKIKRREEKMAPKGLYRFWGVSANFRTENRQKSPLKHIIGRV